MSDPDRQRDSLRSGGYWRSILRAMVAVFSLRLLFRLGAIAFVGLILLAMRWYAG